MNVGIFLIATGKYVDFVKPLCDDLDKYFLTNHEKTVYVFTDADEVPGGATKIYYEHKPWPHPTLYRYHAFTALNPQHDYYYYLDVDMRVVAPVGDEILGDLVGTRHPGFYKKSKLEFSQERRFLSAAFAPFRLLNYYYAGGFNGGSKYLDMARTICKWIDLDQKYGYTPEWFDESYLNKYFAYNPPDVSLDPSYCYPESPCHAVSWKLLECVPKIVCLFKDPEYTHEK